MAEAFAPAKITLTLHITGQRDDGYHLLDALVAFADIGDRIAVEPADAWSLRVTGPMAAGVPKDDGNLVLRAARLIGGAPAAITLDKHLPAASGIGGGSSDAAATLRALHDLDARPIPGDLTRLGADVPVCLHAGPCRMRGIGEVIEPLPNLPPLDAVLVNPGVAVATPAVFGALSTRTNPPMPDPGDALRDARALRAWLATQRNDLEAPARTLAPEIDTARAALGETAPDLVRLCGSGATCLAFYDTADAARAAAQTVSRRHPGWWVAPCTIG
jgi:4-diphosphocytidyl-2-C-methyl-D-erythritol kinase